jgi:uncharacterized membrane protein
MVQESIEVGVPLHTAYHQWTLFEEFPRFMEGVEEVTRGDGRHNHWRTKVGAASREFDTEIVDRLPDQRISWRTVDGQVRQHGMVTFQRLDPDRTMVRLALAFEPEGFAERAADMMGVVNRRVKGDLRRFKSYIEDRGARMSSR